ncbi:MAG TPA: carboxypeptidase-like regulatory domain-containing protein, partial [Candidatus Syntrophosphaera sp.]|nr:carboxypeptidase-like regulatory domain-containing protein [Candidatus Syntrophosphaera sp.]
MLRLTATLCCLLLCASAFAATVSGFVTRSGSAEPMQYVNVVVAGTGIGGQTNRKGYYVITLKEHGRYTLQFSQISSLPKSVEFEVSEHSPDAVVNVSLDKSSVELSKVVVSATAEATYEGPQIRTGTIHR